MPDLPLHQLTVPFAAAPTSDWKQQLREAITDVDSLLKLLGIERDNIDADIDSRFPLRVPRAYVGKMQAGDCRDPLLLQVLPTIDERGDGGKLDPVGDLDAMQAPGLLHKYHGRALLVTTGACAVHCRYCFRRHYPYAGASCNTSRLDSAIAYIRDNEDIEEVILSGGDPLLLDDSRLQTIIERIASIGHLSYLRIHSRLPVVLPDRITGALVETLASSRLRTTLVVHANHANEIRTDESIALDRLRRAGISLLNQSVLLRGINDDAETLIALSKTLHDNHVIPYYLHMLDPVQGAMHFDVSEPAALQIIDRMRARLPGFLVPGLVREIPNFPSKTTISAS